MKAQPFIARLDGLGFVDTGGPLEWATLKSVPRLPAAFYVPGREAAGANSLTDAVGATDQRVAMEFAIMVVLQGTGRSRGQIEEKLDEMTGAVKERLAGWTHPEACAVVEYVGGDPIDAGGELTWAVRFRTAYRFRKVG